MSHKRHNPKRDANEPEIRDALRAVGADVELVNHENTPDLRVWYRGELYWLEVKTKTGKLSDGQKAWIARAIDHNQKVSVVRSVDASLRAIGACVNP